jgi:hypothetical protein
MAQIVRLKRSTTAGSKPTTSNLSAGELAININDGRVFLRKSGSAVGDNIKEFVTLDHEGTLTGSLNISGSITASYFVGDGSGLTNVSVTIGEQSSVRSSFSGLSTVSVDHNLDTPNPLVQVYDNNGYQILPKSIQISNNNTVVVTFDSAESGFVVVANGGHLISGSIAAESISGLDTTIKEKLNTEGVISSSAQITLSGDVTGTAGATVISSIDGGSI